MFSGNTPVWTAVRISCQMGRGICGYCECQVCAIVICSAQPQNRLARLSSRIDAMLTPVNTLAPMPGGCRYYGAIFCWLSDDEDAARRWEATGSARPAAAGVGRY